MKIFRFKKFKIIVSKIISHMGENHPTVPLALIKFSVFEYFNSIIFVYIEIIYKLKSLLKYFATITKLYI